MSRHRRSPRIVAVLHAANQVKELFPDRAGPCVGDYDAAFDADELHETVIGGVWERGLTEESRDHARELALSLAARESTTAEQHAALARLLEALRAW
jgi:hypothetical protein